MEDGLLRASDVKWNRGFHYGLTRIVEEFFGHELHRLARIDEEIFSHELHGLTRIVEELLLATNYTNYTNC